MENKEELVRLIQENPNLKLVFMMSNDEVAGDYGCTVMEDFTAYISNVYKYERWGDLVFSDDKDEVVEYYTEAIEEYVDKNIEHYKAIVIYAK